jgi:hypothetical protein
MDFLGTSNASKRKVVFQEKLATLNNQINRYTAESRQNHKKRLSSESRRMLYTLLLSVLEARDGCEGLQEQDYHSYQERVNLDEEIKHFDLSLRVAINKTSHLVELKSIYKFSGRTDKWWWRHPKHRIFDFFDPLWDVLSLILIVISITYWINLIPKFWAGGFTQISAIAIILPSLLTWILAQEPLSKAQLFPKWLERKLISFKILSWLIKEMCFLLCLAFFVLTLNFNYSSPEISKCYYSWGIQLSPKIEESYSSQRDDANQRVSKTWCKVIALGESSDESVGILQMWQKTYEIIFGQDVGKKSSPTAEIYFQRAVAFNPDNTDAHFMLGWRRESILDFESAKKEYQLAMQSGSGIAATRLAILYLTEGKKDSVASLSNIDFILNRYANGHLGKCDPNDLNICRNSRLFQAVKSDINVRWAKYSENNNLNLGEDKYEKAARAFHAAYMEDKKYLGFLKKLDTNHQTSYLSCLQARITPYISDKLKEELYEPQENGKKEFYWNKSTNELYKQCRESTSFNSRDDLFMSGSV